MDFQKQNIIDFLNIALQITPGKGCGPQMSAINELPKSYKGLKVDASVGIGRGTVIPWISFTGYEQETSNGIYPVILFFYQTKILIVAFGISVDNPPKESWGSLGMQTLEQYFAENNIPQTDREKKYNSSFVHSVFHVDVTNDKVDETSFDVDRVFDSLSKVCEIYNDHFESKNRTVIEVQQSPFSLYKHDFPTFWNEERYKWEAVQRFQEKWDIEADDFSTMIKDATDKHGNLLASMNYYPIRMIQDFAAVDKERTRNMFRMLYDEEKDLAHRITNFIEEAEAMRKTHDSEWKNHYQDLRAISVYLLSRYPEKYYIYKYTELKRTVELLGDNFSFKGKNDNGTFYASCVEYLNDLSKRLLVDEELQTIMHEKLDNDDMCYNDTERHITTTDFFFYVGKRLDVKRLNPNAIDTSIDAEDEPMESLFNPKDTLEQIPFEMMTLIKNIKRTGLLYEEKLIKRYVCSLMTKPFVILSGLAGSGKTQLALVFARVMSENIDQQLCVVPVGADWTNREPLLGYPNALKQGEYMLPECGALQIMMRAFRNPNKPYFLVLDEMNLSYVERYFADFLSALESHQEIPLWEKPDECDSEVPAKIVLPKNLFIIGTINVDETTYMFSPKVLDRANVIEFKISENEMETFLKQNMNVSVDPADGLCANMGQDFVDKSTQKETGSSALAQETLIEFFKVLKKVNAEFGYRSATEIYRFIAKAKDCGMIDEQILDAAIVQKLLPKLHGSRKKLEPALKALWKLCMDNDHTTEPITLDNLKFAKFPESADKIQRMMQTALENGFTSFAEA